jgi:hypothetical protein
MELSNGGSRLWITTAICFEKHLIPAIAGFLVGDMNGTATDSQQARCCVLIPGKILSWRMVLNFKTGQQGAMAAPTLSKRFVSPPCPKTCANFGRQC